MPPPIGLIAAAALLDSNIFPRDLSRKSDNKLKGKTMKKIIIGLACALIAPLAFAQTSTTTETTRVNPATGTTTTETSTTYASGTVTTYEPGKTIVVRSEKEGPLSFALKAPVRIVDK